MTNSNRSRNNMNRTCRKRHHITLKDFGSLSFDVVVGAAPVGPGGPHQSWPVPDSEWDREVHRSGSTDSEAPASHPRKCGEALAEIPRGRVAVSRVLIADDTPSVRESLAKLLRAEGYEVEVAANGKEALEKFDPERIDLVLLDLDMPVTNGWDALERLMAIKPDQAVIIITGKSEPRSWIDVCRAGILMEKPINVTVLLGAIRQALAESAPSRKERIAVQHALTRHTRPCPEPFRRQCFPRGGLNE
jgi:CheY-like chemotaxis protein